MSILIVCSSQFLVFLLTFNLVEFFYFVGLDWKFKFFFSAIYISIEVFELFCLVASMITYRLFRHMHLLENVNLF